MLILPSRRLVNCSLFLSIYTSFAMIHSILTRLYVCDHRKSSLGFYLPFWTLTVTGSRRTRCICRRGLYWRIFFKKKPNLRKEQSTNDVKQLTLAKEPIILATGIYCTRFSKLYQNLNLTCPAILSCIRVLGGYTKAESSNTVFDTDSFTEKKYVDYIHETSGNISLALSWYVDTN